MRTDICMHFVQRTRNNERHSFPVRNVRLSNELGLVDTAALLQVCRNRMRPPVTHDSFFAVKIRKCLQNMS
jgi:hypothetical protein